MAKQGFTKASRLLGPPQFSRVFEKTDFKLSTATLLVLVSKSNQAPRLGIVIAKKHVKGATQRNRLKRIIRESFRLRKEEFGTIDMVILARHGLQHLSNQDVFSQLEYLFDELKTKLNRKP